ncbi:MAG: cytidylate kinase-like family protein [Ignavibacteria bacterium]|nr:cytidylate kinase-like family protein [Ignavibacteria bacterium]
MLYKLYLFAGIVLPGHPAINGKELSVMEYNKYVDLSKAYLFSQLQRNKDTKKTDSTTETIHPFITISREAGTGESSLTARLVDYLSFCERVTDCPWALFDKNLIEKVNEDYKLRGINSLLPEEKFSDIQGMFEELFGLHPTKREMVYNINKSILKLAGMGEVVIVGRGGFYITRHLKNGLHVRLIGSLAKRTKHMMDCYELSLKKAEDYVKKEDMKRYDYIKKLFGVDINDPHNYDIMINTDHIQTDEAIDLIASHIFRLKRNVNLN